jgi:hypothetical protein
MGSVFYQLGMFEDASELRLHQRAKDMYSALFDVDQESRTRMKHGNTTDDEYTFLERLR